MHPVYSHTAFDDSNEVPAFDRLLSVAAGYESWTEEEREAKRLSPEWCIAESQAHLTLAMLQTTPLLAVEKLRHALDEIKQLPDPDTIAAAYEYLRTFLAGELLIQFDQMMSTADEAVPTSPTATNAATERISVNTAAFRHRRFMIAAIAASIAMLCIVWSRREVPLTVTRTVAILNADVSKGVLPALHSGDELEYKAHVLSNYKQVWFITVDNERAFVRDYAETRNGTAQLSFTGILDARDCFEFFVIVASDQELFPIPDGHTELPIETSSLTAIATELQSLGANDASNAMSAQARILANIRRFNKSTKCEVHVESFEHLSSPRAR